MQSRSIIHPHRYRCGHIQSVLESCILGCRSTRRNIPENFYLLLAHRAYRKLQSSELSRRALHAHRFVDRCPIGGASHPIHKPSSDSPDGFHRTTSRAGAQVAVVEVPPCDHPTCDVRIRHDPNFFSNTHNIRNWISIKYFEVVELIVVESRHDGVGYRTIKTRKDRGGRADQSSRTKAGVSCVPPRSRRCIRHGTPTLPQYNQIVTWVRPPIQCRSTILPIPSEIHRLR